MATTNEATRFTNLENQTTASTIRDESNGEVYASSGKADHRLSVARCRELLGEDADKLKDEEVICLRDFLYRLADIICGDIERSHGKEEGVCGAA